MSNRVVVELLGGFARMSTPSETPLPGRVSTVEALATALRAEVLSGALAPGTQLREAELCSRYGVSRHSLRTALVALAHEGIFTHEPNRGVFVTQLTATDVAEIYGVRIALETEACRVICTENEPLDEILGSLQALEDLGPGGDWHDHIDADLRFHRSVVATAGNSRLLRDYLSLESEVRLCLVYFKPDAEARLATTREHREVTRALRKRDPERADRAVRRHLERSIRALTPDL